MNGFFEDLVARSYTPALALRPRLQSLYEPPARDDGPHIDAQATLSARTRREHVLEEAAEISQPRNTRRAIPDAGRDLVSRLQHTRPLNTEAEEARRPLSATESATPRMPRSERNDAPLVSPVRSEHQPVQPRPALQSRPAATIQPTTSPAEKNAIHGNESQAKDSASQHRMAEAPAPLKPPPAPLAQPAPPQAIQVVAPRREARESAEHRPRALSPTLLAPLASKLRPLAPERSPRRGEAPRAAVSPNAEPAIHVTIGRIEVRADVQEPPARPAAKQRPPAGPNLDDYLRQHAPKGRS